MSGGMILGKQLGELAAPVVKEMIGELRGIIDEVSGGEENRQLKSKMVDKLTELEITLAERDAKIYEHQTKVLVADATGVDPLQRRWRPISALTVVAVTGAVVISNMILFPAFQVVTPEDAWPVMHTLLLSVSTLLGIQVAGRSFEKSIGTRTMGDLLSTPLQRDRKAEAKAMARKVRAWRKAGLSPEQIEAQLEREGDE